VIFVRFTTKHIRTSDKTHREILSSTPKTASTIAPMPRVDPETEALTFQDDQQRNMRPPSMWALYLICFGLPRRMAWPASLSLNSMQSWRPICWMIRSGLLNADILFSNESKSDEAHSQTLAVIFPNHCILGVQLTIILC